MGKQLATISTKKTALARREPEPVPEPLVVVARPVSDEIAFGGSPVYEPDENSKLTAAQHRAVAVLAAGGTIATAAAALGLSRSTLWRWSSKDAEFKLALNLAIRDSADASRAARREIVTQALTVIKDWMARTSPPGIRLRAALAALEVTGEATDPKVGPTDINGVKAKLNHEALRQSLAAF